MSQSHSLTHLLTMSRLPYSTISMLFVDRFGRSYGFRIQYKQFLMVTGVKIPGIDGGFKFN